MKKFIVAMMIIALVVVMAVSISAEANPAADFEYEVVGEAVTIKKYKGTTAEVEIPATIESKPVTVIATGAFDSNDAVTKIVIPDSVTEIGEKAIYKCKGVKTLVIGKGVKTVGKQAISRLGALETITVAAECTALKAENGCLIDVAAKTVIVGIQQETVKIPAGVEHIGGYSFYGPGTCKGVLKTVIISDGVKTIGDYAFDATMLSTLVIPKTVTTMGNAVAANTPLHKTRAGENNVESGNIYYEGTKEEYDAITKGATANNAIKGSHAPIHAGSCINNPNGWTHSEGATCTYCNPPAGGQTPPAGGNQGGAAQTGSSITLLAIVAVVALAATSVVISKRRIED